MASKRQRSKWNNAKALLLVVPLLAFAVVTIGAPADTKAPLFAMISATALSISILPTPQTRPGRIVQLTVLTLAGVSGLGSAWSWLESIGQVAFFWYTVAFLLVLVAAAALLMADRVFRSDLPP